MAVQKRKMSKGLLLLVFLFLHWFGVFQCSDSLEINVRIKPEEGQYIDPDTRDHEIVIYNETEVLYISCESSRPHRAFWSKIPGQMKYLKYKGTIKNNPSNGLIPVITTSWSIDGRSKFSSFLGCQSIHDLTETKSRKAILSGNQPALSELRQQQLTPDMINIHNTPLIDDFMKTTNTGILYHNSNESPQILYSDKQRAFYCHYKPGKLLSFKVIGCEDSNWCDNQARLYSDETVLPENLNHLNACLKHNCSFLALGNHPPQGIAICMHEAVTVVRRYVTGLDKKIYFPDEPMPEEAYCRIEKKAENSTSSFYVVKALNYFCTLEMSCKKTLTDGSEEAFLESSIVRHDEMDPEFLSQGTTSMGVYVNNNVEYLKCDVPLLNSETPISLKYLNHVSAISAGADDTLLIVAVVIIIALTAISVTVACIKFRRSRTGQPVESIPLEVIQNPPQQVSEDWEQRLLNYVGPLDESMKIDRNEIEDTGYCGEGATGEVREGIYNGLKVALKKMLTDKFGVFEAIRKLEREIRVHQFVNGCDKIVKLIGYVEKQAGKGIMVLQYCSNGNLYPFKSYYRSCFHNMLEQPEQQQQQQVEGKLEAAAHQDSQTAEIRKPNENEAGSVNPSTSFNNSQKPPVFNTALLIKWALGMIEAVSFLHKKKLSHQDIAPRNFLIDSDYNIKLCDFGRCRLAVDGGRKDILKLGNTLWWLFSADNSMTMPKRNTYFVNPEFANQTIVDLILKCRDHSADSPPFDEMTQGLTAVLNGLPQGQTVDL